AARWSRRERPRRSPRRRAVTRASSCAGCCRCTRRSERLSAEPRPAAVPVMSVRARAVIPDGGGRVLFDRTHHFDRAPFYWLPGGGVEPGETAEEALGRELIEEASLVIHVRRLLYISENLFVESGDYRHEVILYFLAEAGETLPGAPIDLRHHEW